MTARRLTTLLTVLLLSFGLKAQDPEAIKFAFLTDLHYSAGSYSVNDLRRCIADVNSLDGLDFVMVGGDLTDFGTDEELSAVKSMLDSLKYRYWVVAGNHDAKWSESGCNTFKKVFGYESFEFGCKGWRFVGCNSGPDMRMAPALIPQESMEWLKSLEPGEKTVFINHFPQDSSVLNYFDVTRELKRIGVRMLIGGHWHRNTALSYDGLPGILGRSTMSAGRNPGYSIVKIEGDKITVAERRLLGDTTVQLEPWYSKELKEVKDTVSYDSHGLPASYPWMRYDVNDGSVEEVWKFQDNSNIAGGFALSGGKAWYATASGSVRCISVGDGKVLWSKDFPGKIFSTPAVSGKILVFGCADGSIYALNAKNGKTLWTCKAAKSVLSSPAIHGGTVYVGASDGVFRAIDLKTGRIVWEYSDVEGFVESRPYVDDEQVVFGTWANRLYSLNTSDGSLQWIWRCEKPSRMYSPAATWPVKSSGKLFIAVPDRRLYALDAATGKEIKHFDRTARESVGISQDGKTVYCKSMWHKIFGIDAETLEIVWEQETGTGYDISPTSIEVMPDGGVLMPTDKGNIVCFKDGERAWAHKISIALVNPMQVWTEDGRTCILASTMDGVVTLLKTN